MVIATGPLLLGFVLLVIFLQKKLNHPVGDFLKNKRLPTRLSRRSF